MGCPDEDYIEELKAIVAGRLEVGEMPVIFLTNIRQHVPAGLDRATLRSATRLLAQAEFAAIDVCALRSEGEADPPIPAFLSVAPTSAPALKPSIRDVFRNKLREQATNSLTTLMPLAEYQGNEGYLKSKTRGDQLIERPRNSDEISSKLP